MKRKRQCFKDRPKGSEVMASYDQGVVEGMGVNGLACACGRWLHEECVDGCIRDVGNEHICPYCCLDNLATMYV